MAHGDRQKGRPGIPQSPEDFPSTEVSLQLALERAFVVKLSRTRERKGPLWVQESFGREGTSSWGGSLACWGCLELEVQARQYCRLGGDESGSSSEPRRPVLSLEHGQQPPALPISACSNVAAFSSALPAASFGQAGAVMVSECQLNPQLNRHPRLNAAT